ncbi:DUF4352 domain-containing protein [Mammaliicoccus fleurettii]|uniref:DUF4352 domain-containing protein n=1 Tax=Mammaliicoccus fleurettii TaxID=150056 RepID=UPI002DB87FDC|nr:DUF4352 domain-containing protein [Mammaliicoccus fleurettii]MEB7780795.1 DUF4352 domain-containing protein [Mammaliicoccus fleurettii]
MKKIMLLIMVAGLFLVGCNSSNIERKAESNDNKKHKSTHSKRKANEQMKTFKVGEVVDADGVDIIVTKVEFNNDYDEYSAPENGQALKVSFKFKNHNDDQVLVDNSAFTMKSKQENFQEWFGTDDNHAGFSHLLNKGNIGTGYIYYDVPDSQRYTLEMDFVPLFDTVRGKWEIRKSDIKGNSNTNSSTSTNETTNEMKETEDDSGDYPYTAEEYNYLVDEYNSLTEGEKMNRVSRGVTNKEYNDLLERIEKEYDRLGDEADKEYEDFLKEQEKIDAEYEEEMRKEEERQAKEDAAYEKEQAEEDAAYEEEMRKEEERQSIEDAAYEEEMRKEEERQAIEDAEFEEKMKALDEE